jgi:uncharacterized protein YjbI with pentapeptide repeats
MPRWPTATQSPGEEQETSRIGAPYSVQVQGDVTCSAWASGAAAARTIKARKAPMAALRNVRGLGTAGRLRGIDACHLRSARPALALFAALVTAFAVLVAAPAARAEVTGAAADSVASANPPAPPFVVVHATLVREDGHAFVEGKVEWDGPAAHRAPDYMTAGDLRLVAVSGDGHHPTVLATEPYARIAEEPSEDVRLEVKADDERAIAPGNRVVLTASQHGGVSPQGGRTAKTYVTVDQLQPFGDPQDRIGRRDCAGEAIVQGAKLNECDLVGADLERALVSVRYPDGTRMPLADLTGANLHGADLTGLSVAGGRLNGADASAAILDNVSLAGAEGSGLDAHDSRSDATGLLAAGANIYDARLTGANFAGAVLKGVSFKDSILDGADFRGGSWTSVEASTTSFRGADLRGLQGSGVSTVYLSDFTDARLGGAPLTPLNLEWATLCHTQMPDGKSVDDRDCRAESDPGPKPVAGRKVAVDGTLERSGDSATIKATVKWSPAGIASGMTAGDVRAVAIDGKTGLPTKLGSLSIAGALPGTSSFEAKVDPDKLAALDHGNRVVVTATQHPPLPRSGQTNGSFVTVDTLQPGPGRGRVGSRDCSDLTLGVPAPVPGGYNFCDLAGATLTKAKLSGSIREADLSGGVLTGAELTGAEFDASALGGVDLTGAELANVSLVGASAPRLTMPKTALRGSQWRAANLDEANFAGDTIADSIFAASSLTRATFTNATLGKVDLAYTGLEGAKLDGVDAAGSDRGRPRRSSLFLADLTGATLAGSKWNDDESGERPWTWATLCDTVLPADATVSGNRDCPRSPTG